MCLVNLDETSVSFAESRRCGNVVRARRGSLTSLFYERISRRETHGHLTLVGLLSADPEWQGFMPQLLLTKDKSLSVAEKAALGRLQRPVYWLPGTDGWVTRENLPHVLTVIRRHIHHHLPHHEIVVLLDCAAQHVNFDVINHAGRLRIHLLFIPGRLTWLLQPLDTHVFAKFKRKLHDLQAEARAEAEDGTLPRTAWVGLLQTAIKEILVERSWGHAFTQNGIVPLADGNVRARIFDACNAYIEPRPVAPTDDDFQMVFNRRIPNVSRRVLSRANHLVAAGAPSLPSGVDAEGEALPPLPPPLEAPPPELEGPISSRTRLRRASSVFEH